MEGWPVLVYQTGREGMDEGSVEGHPVREGAKLDTLGPLVRLKMTPRPSYRDRLGGPPDTGSAVFSRAGPICWMTWTVGACGRQVWSKARVATMAATACQLMGLDLGFIANSRSMVVARRPG